MEQFASNEFYKSQYVEEGEANLEWKHELILSLLKDTIGNKVLEIGCGNGVFARKVALKFNLTEIYGIDI